MPVTGLFIRKIHMSRPATRFADDSAALPHSAKKMRVMRALLAITWPIAVLLILDATVLGGRYRQTAWREAQTNVQMFNYHFNYHVNRMVQFAGPGR